MVGLKGQLPPLRPVRPRRRLGGVGGSAASDLCLNFRSACLGPGGGSGREANSTSILCPRGGGEVLRVCRISLRSQQRLPGQVRIRRKCGRAVCPAAERLAWPRPVAAECPRAAAPPPPLPEFAQFRAHGFSQRLEVGFWVIDTEAPLRLFLSSAESTRSFQQGIRRGRRRRRFASSKNTAHALLLHSACWDDANGTWTIREQLTCI